MGKYYAILTETPDVPEHLIEEIEGQGHRAYYESYITSADAAEIGMPIYVIASGSQPTRRACRVRAKEAGRALWLIKSKHLSAKQRREAIFYDHSNGLRADLELGRYYN